MKKKIYTLVLATLGLFASVDVGAQTWEWKGEEVSGTDPQFYIQNYDSKKFLVNASETLSDNFSDACLFTLEGSGGYKLKNANGRYLSWGGAQELNVNKESKLTSWPQNVNFERAYTDEADPRSDCYRFASEQKVPITNQIHYLYLKGDGTLTKGASTLDNGLWRMISPAQKDMKAQFEKFLADTLTAEDIKDKAIVTAIKSVASYNYLTYQQASATIRAYRAAAAELETPVSIPEGYAEHPAALQIPQAVEAAKAALEAATTKEAFAAALKIKSDAIAALGKVIEVKAGINEELTVAHPSSAAYAALIAQKEKSNTALETAATVEAAQAALDAYNTAKTFVQTVETAYIYVQDKKNGVQSDNAETAAYAALTTALADAETALAAAENADDVDAAKAIMNNAIQFVGTVDTALSSLPAGQQSGQDSAFAEAYAAAFNTLGAALTTAQGAISAATDEETVTAAKSAYNAAYDLYQTKSNQFRGVEEIAEQFADSETLMNLAAEAMNTVAAATSDTEAMTAIPELTENVTTVYTAGNIDDSKAAEGSDVDINDYAELASIILKATYTRQQKPELSETPDMAERLAVRKYNLCDANEDNKVNVADLTKIVLIIKGQTQSFAKGMNAISGTISTVAAGNDLIFSLANTGMMTGMQLDVTLPAGISVMNQTLSARAANHSIEVNNIGGNTYRVLVSGMGNAAFAEGAGEMFRLSLTGAASSVEVSEAYASDANANSYDLQVAGNSTTGINTVEAQQADAVAIYSIGGKQQSSMNKGVNILVGADGKANKVLK